MTLETNIVLKDFMRNKTIASNLINLLIIQITAFGF